MASSLAWSGLPSASSRPTSSPPMSVLPPQQVRRLGHAVVTQRHDQQQARAAYRCSRRGTATGSDRIRTGGEVEPGLPAEVLDPAGAEGVDVEIGGLRIQDLAWLIIGLSRTQNDATVLLTLGSRC